MDQHVLEFLISKIEKDLHIKVKDRVLQILRRSTFRGYRIEDAVIAAAYIAIKEKGYPISFRELLKYNGIPITSRREVFKIISKIVKEQNIKLAFHNIDALVEKYARKFGLSPLEKKKAKDIAKLIYKAGKNPLGIVATAIYLVKQQDQLEIAKAIGVTPVTIRKNVFEYYKKASLIGELEK
jgi:transcription initiation factor TFIIIB Brf1 subunit/transcription initiation factor TFIIB